MQIHIISLFPQEVEAFAGVGVVGRALQNGKLELRVWNPRRHTSDVHASVDDRPYGGGPGMVMCVEPLRKTIAEVKSLAPKGSPVIYMSPAGCRFDQQQAVQMAQLPGMILVAGRYEGIDERLIVHDIDIELSIGDYVLSGGELPALAVMDAVARLIPGVLGDEESALQDSFMQGALDYPHYTRPAEIDGQKVPEVLLSGDHQAIAEWRKQQALQRTQQRRPDLLEKNDCSEAGNKNAVKK
ncbi:MAG: tRNA (guanosine(37)-N1)-methyltransferase TrmD [Gammaproteobacteria bacterium]|nr:tRNA (guanosine(37)-N1)-methyltransferase TrmD [Gammaproteobacteria bacterium]NNC98341.1 tRNA (guanosine(37)-N1)-methyltransferase TrmD [Gammaproteobacteria bacterium]NNM14400.1 tRNA (guanosine(37)-N1)-methyltransferase TrmD [Gammaproteobacteria bacterium]